MIKFFLLVYNHIFTFLKLYYAVQLPSGELHRWFARSELETFNSLLNDCEVLCQGSLAKIISTEGHPSHIMPGTVVRIIKSIDQVPYYDVILDDKGYHRWLADFEIVPLDTIT